MAGCPSIPPLNNRCVLRLATARGPRHSSSAEPRRVVPRRAATTAEDNALHPRGPHTRKGCSSYLSSSQPARSRRAGSPRRQGRPAPVAVRAPQHPAHRTSSPSHQQPVPSEPVPGKSHRALTRPAHSLAALPSAARRCISTPGSPRAGRGTRPATPRPPQTLCVILPAVPRSPCLQIAQSAHAPGSLARSPPIRGAQVHLDARVAPRRSRYAPRNTPPAADALRHFASRAAFPVPADRTERSRAPSLRPRSSRAAPPSSPLSAACAWRDTVGNCAGVAPGARRGGTQGWPRGRRRAAARASAPRRHPGQVDGTKYVACGF